MQLLTIVGRMALIYNEKKTLKLKIPLSLVYLWKMNEPGATFAYTKSKYKWKLNCKVSTKNFLPRHRQLHFCKIIIYSNPFRNTKKLHENYDLFKNFRSETEMHENAHSKNWSQQLCKIKRKLQQGKKNQILQKCFHFKLLFFR